MSDQIVHTPASLLLCPTVPPTEKLLWMTARLGPASARPGTSWLSARTGLTRTTVLKGLAQLRAQGWERLTSTAGATVPIPGTLLTNQRLTPQARVLYGILLLTPGFHHPSGQSTFAELSALAHASRNTVAKALAALVHEEWIKADRAHRKAPIHFELTFPGRERGEIALAAAQARLGKPKIHYGEALMRVTLPY